MTLCIAAKCATKNNEPRFVLCADKRVEVGWAGADVAFKLAWAAVNWPALVAGDIAKAHDLLATFRGELRSAHEAHKNTVFDKLNAAVSLHKKKLCERFVSQKLGISLERFLTKGEHELTPEIRNRTLLQLEELNFDCEVMLAAFLGNGQPFLFSIAEDGEVTEHQNFAAIGTGSVIARSTLYYRQQNQYTTIEETLYNLFEASQLAKIAPGVGEITEFVIMLPPEKGKYEVSKFYRTNDHYRKLLQKTFKRIGPKPLKQYFVLGEQQHLIKIGSTEAETDDSAAKASAKEKGKKASV